MRCGSPASRPLPIPAVPRATPADLQTRRPCCTCGGSVIQDLGYYPLRQPLLQQSAALRAQRRLHRGVGPRRARRQRVRRSRSGALAHYASDAVGHPEAVNPSVPLLFPKLKASNGDERSPTPSRRPRTCEPECSFDIVQIAAGAATLPECALTASSGSGWRADLWTRAFRETYGIETKDMLRRRGSRDLDAIARRSAS